MKKKLTLVANAVQIFSGLSRQRTYLISEVSSFSPSLIRAASFFASKTIVRI